MIRLLKVASHVDHLMVSGLTLLVLSLWCDELICYSSSVRSLPVRSW